MSSSRRARHPLKTPRIGGDQGIETPGDGLGAPARFAYERSCRPRRGRCVSGCPQGRPRARRRANASGDRPARTVGWRAMPPGCESTRATTRVCACLRAVSMPRTGRHKGTRREPAWLPLRHRPRSRRRETPGGGFAGTESPGPCRRCSRADDENPLRFVDGRLLGHGDLPGEADEEAEELLAVERSARRPGRRSRARSGPGPSPAA